MATGRPNLGRDDSYNRVRLTNDMKSTICNMIADSSESLPLTSVSEYEEQESQDTQPNAKTLDNNNLAPPQKSNGTSKLSDSMASSDFPTPTPEKPNPLEQIPTVRKPHTTNDDENTVQETPSPVRTHELVGHSEAIAPRVLKSNLIPEASESNLDLTSQADSRDKESIGTDASRQTTVSATPSNASGKKENETLRPGMMKRMSTAIKRSVSKNQ